MWSCVSEIVGEMWNGQSSRRTGRTDLISESTVVRQPCSVVQSRRRSPWTACHIFIHWPWRRPTCTASVCDLQRHRVTPHIHRDTTCLLDSHTQQKVEFPQKHIFRARMTSEALLSLWGCIGSNSEAICAGHVKDFSSARWWNGVRFRTRSRTLSVLFLPLHQFTVIHYQYSKP